MASFESFRRVDVYGFAMVMWETVRRCMTHDGVEVSCLSLLMMMVLITVVIMMTMTMKMMTTVPSQDFALPFHDMVLPDPGFEDMHKVQGCQNGFLDFWQNSFAVNKFSKNCFFQVVCVDSYRPQIPPRWEGDKVKKDKKQ